MLYIAAAAVLAFFAARALKRARSGTAQENARGGEPPVAKDTADAPAKSIPVADNWPSRPPVIRSVSSLQPASLAKSTMRWVGNGECFAIGGYSLQDPMVYCADKYSRDIDASCIVASLPVTSPVLEPKGALGYWPEYTHLSPGQRANYLAWLAGGRRGPLADIGYVFIYFYGLERRVLVDGKDAWAAVEEVLGLLRTYRDSRSLDGYLSSFVAFIIALSGLQHLDEKAFKRLLMTGLPAHTDNTLRLCLAWHCAHAKGPRPIWPMKWHGAMRGARVVSC